MGQDSKPDGGVLQEKLLSNGREALRSLCANGCNYEELGGLFAWLAGFKVVGITSTSKAKLPTDAESINPPVILALDPRVLDTRNTAHPGFSLKQLRALAELAANLRDEVAKLRETPLVGFLVDSGFIASGDLLAGSPLGLFDGSAPFRGLIDLSEFAKQCGPQKMPDHTRIRKQIHRYIHEHTGKWNDKLFAAIYNDLFKKECVQEKDVGGWRTRHGLKSRPSPKNPK